MSAYFIKYTSVIPYKYTNANSITTIAEISVI